MILLLLLVLMLCQLFYWNASVLTPPKRQSKANPRLESIGVGYPRNDVFYRDFPSSLLDASTDQRFLRLSD